MPLRTKTKACTHEHLTFAPSSHASKVGYKQPTPRQLIVATSNQGTTPTTVSSSSSELGDQASTFPAPLVLPGDELSWEPTYHGQSVSSWVRGSYRNAVTREGRTLYLVPPPIFGKGLEEAEKWKKPVLKGKKTLQERATWTERDTENVLGYLRAFYHGMEVKIMPGERLCFSADGDEEGVPMPPVKKAGKGKGRGKGNAAETKSPTLWLQTHDSTFLLGVRTRAIPKGLYSHQLNLNDLLEAAMEILPQDAYAIFMLVEHDMFEDEEDDFACGRAYGGSRVCCVSTARYDPALDAVQEVPRDHGWPASHCTEYIEKCVSDAEVEEEEEEVEPKKKKQKKSAVEKSGKGAHVVVSPMQAALKAHVSLPSLETSPSVEALAGLWLGRVCRTASHELGHCFGMDNCVYYACCMQGTASIIEDARHPPYLCPVDLQKVLYATGAGERESYKRLEEFCERFGEVQMFKALAAWIRGSIRQLDGEKQDNTRDNPIVILD